ncbi:MAG: proprotein convertase P-domain-containing protein [Bdellovibrionales bacterium]|nr:proprotein convertase P-domain-containing protein [Bdellovibrionales bacterium]
MKTIPLFLSKAYLLFLCFIILNVVGSVPVLADPPNSNICSFITNEVSSTDVPKNITDFTTTESTLVVSGVPSIVRDVDITLSISHTFAADLDVVLVSPAGTEVTLTTDNGAGNDNVFQGTTFDDQATDVVTQYTFMDNVVATKLIPEGALWAFSGENPNGTWKLKVTDDLAPDAGTINSWSLNLSSCEGSQPIAVETGVWFSNPALAIPDNDLTGVTATVDVFDMQAEICQVELTLNLPHTFASDIEAILESPSGKTTQILLDNGGGLDNIYDGSVFTDKAGAIPVSDFPNVDNVVSTPITPVGAMAAFIGESPNGTWKLHLLDDANSDTGTLNTWILKILTCDKDTDADGVGDLNDNCINSANIDQADSDADGTGNACDTCPNDPSKITPGTCGCGIKDVDKGGIQDGDTESNGILDCLYGAEANNFASDIKARVDAVKYGKNRKKRKATRTEIAEILSLIDTLGAYISTHSSDILFAQGGTFDSTSSGITKLSKQLKKLKKKLKVSKSAFNRLRSKAGKTAGLIEGSLPST